MLVITYTRKAAGELRARVRTALGEPGRPELARELDEPDVCGRVTRVAADRRRREFALEAHGAG